MPKKRKNDAHCELKPLEKSQDKVEGWQSIRAVDYVPVVLSAADALPTRDSLQDTLAQVETAEKRGYFLPNEDEQLREVYSLYLAIRSSLFECVHTISGGRLSVKHTARLPDFIVAYAAACILVRSANFIVELATRNPIGREKLDEPEARYGLKAKNFTRIYESLTSPKKWWGFFEAVHFFQINRSEILKYTEDPVLGKVVELLFKEEAFITARRRDFLQQRLSYRLYSFFRRNRVGYRKVMFGLFKVSGSTIADLKQPFVKPAGVGKRVTPAVRERLEAFLQPGDVLVTRHDDAVSNLFLPGFWPHAAFYIGSNQQREALGVCCDCAIENTVRFLEAKKDGVKLRPPEDTLQIDAFVVLRPMLPAKQIAEAVSRCLTHAGKQFDFIFDFSTSDRLACTELVYRSYHSVGEVVFELQSLAGCFRLSAEDLINQTVGKGWFEPVLIYGVREDEWIQGAEAHSVLKESYAAGF